MKNSNQTIRKAFVGAIKEFISLSPMILAVIGLVAVFQTYITPKMLSQFFGHGSFYDTLSGTILGAIATGNGAIAYMVADGLKTQGISEYALISFILAWTTLSITHLPAEASVFGIRFTVYRNILTFLSTLLISYLSVVTVELIASMAKI